MIEIDDFTLILKRENFDEEAIDRILHKKIKTLLKRATKQRLKKIFEILDKHDISRKSIENCLSVLARGKAKEIEGIFKVLDEHEISKETIERCLSVLAYGKAKEIEEIFKVLDEHKISKETIENCLTVLARGKAKEIEGIFKVLDEHKISKEAIEKYYGIIFNNKSVEYIKEVFSNNPNSDILLYMKLNEIHNRAISKEEIEQICMYKNISSIKQFIVRMSKIGKFEEVLLETLMKKGNIYIGKSCPMTQKQINQYSEIILKIANNVGKNLAYKYYNHRDREEFSSYALEVIIGKCGDICYNTEINPNIMERCIYNKCKKYLIGSILKKDIKYVENSFDELAQINAIETSYEEKEENNLNLEKWNLKKQQQEILQCLSIFIEKGFSYQEAMKYVSEELDLEEEELYAEIDEIKNLIKSQEMQRR